MGRTYLIGIDDNGNTGCGSDYDLVTYYKSKDRVLALAEKFRRVRNLKEVYAITNYTQSMCEMEPKVFTEYIKEHGIKVAERG